MHFPAFNFPYVAVIHDDHIIFYLDDKDHVTGPAVFITTWTVRWLC